MRDRLARTRSTARAPALPLAIGAHLDAARRRKRHAVRFTAIPALKAAAAGMPKWRRHAGAALVVAALATLGLALAKPQRTVAVPLERASIMLVTDHSRSMLETDVEHGSPARGTKAARTFLDEVRQRAASASVTFSDAPDSVHARDRTRRRAGRDRRPDGRRATAPATHSRLRSKRSLATAATAGARPRRSFCVRRQDHRGWGPVDVAGRRAVCGSRSTR